ncbi:MAG: murein biosynthesis integral membrane protein MurJ [Rickettsiales bacterium]|jgi:putative peptidoglycan lipid II flippase|nr:murein biosynthesis integral membrane protein MurJ [Rickettsiales bacterium]
MSLGKHIFKVGAWTGISRICGFVRDMLIARVLGAGRLSDIFLTAFKLPNLFREIIGEGAFTSIFVPMFVEKNKQGQAQSEKFASTIFSWLMMILLVITIVCEILMPLIVLVFAPGFSDDPAKFQTTVLISRIMFFYMIFICGSAILSCVLNAFNQFALVAAVPILLNLFLIGGLLLASYLGAGANALYILAAAVVLSGMVQLWILWGRLRRRKFGLRIIRPRITENIKTLGKRLGLGFIGSGFYQLNIIIGTLIASYQSGAVSWLYYSDRIVQLPFAMIGLAAGTVLLTTVSQSIAHKQYDDIYKQQNSSVRNIMMLTIPCVVGLFVLAVPIIQYLFEYGAWTHESTIAVASAIMIQALALPAMTTSQIFNKTLYAAQDVKTPVKINSWAMLFSIAFMLAGFGFFGYLIVPISTVITGYIRNIFYRRACKRRDLWRAEPRTVRANVCFCALAGILGAGLWFVPIGSIYALGAAIAGFGVLYLPLALLINKKI